MTTGAYIDLLDWTARQIRKDKRGSTPTMQPIFERLGISGEVWCGLVKDFFWAVVLRAKKAKKGTQLIRLIDPMCDFLDQPLWIYQQGQGPPDSDTNAVAYKRIEFRYNDIGQLTYVNRFETATTSYGTPSLRTVLEYDDANRIVLLSHKAAEHQIGVTVLAQYDFEYDFASRITAIDSFVDGRSEFAFSTTNQLTDADHDIYSSSSNNNPNEAYTFDANGNRIGTGFVVDAQNRTMSDGVYDYEYDAEGNHIRRTLISDDSYEINTFDHRNRLTKVEFYNSSDVLQQSVTYTYDAFNRLVRRSVDSDGDHDIDVDQFFAGFDGDNSTLEFDGPDDTDLVHRRLWGPFVDQLIASEDVDSLLTAGEVLWPVTDHVGTIRDIGILDNGMGGGGDFIIVSHRVFSSFGVLTDEYDPATSNPSGVDIEFGFTGRFTDDLTGMTHHLYRWYDPQLGKWISEDPLGFAAGDINTTRYVDNAPLSYTDPTGLIAVSIDGGNGDADQGGRQDSNSGTGVGGGSSSGGGATGSWNDSGNDDSSGSSGSDGSDGSGNSTSDNTGLHTQGVHAILNGANPDALLDASPWGTSGHNADEFGNRYRDKGGGHVNAARHIYWQIALTARWSENQARLIGNAHEVGETGPDTHADLDNNVIGRQYGLRLNPHSEPFWRPNSVDWDEITELAEEAMANEPVVIYPK